MKTKDFILKKAKQKNQITAAEIVHELDISRQAATKHLRELVFTQKLIKEGSTRNAVYCIPAKSYGHKKPSLKKHIFQYHLKGLNEDRVFDIISSKINLTQHLSKNALHIIQYAFTEMLNNAIDHSHASRVRCELLLDKGNLEFTISERGIGAYESLKKKFKLKDHYEALEHLLKGKQSSDPSKHSGQGIFFTSRVSDRFYLDSASLRLNVNNIINDISVKKIPFYKGTRVKFLLKIKSRKDLKAIFDAYTNEDFEFDRTEIFVKLIKKEGEYVSRSEAKRLLFGLNKFKRIVFDFNNVESIGQSFADEIFRVYQNNNPSISVKGVHMNAEVNFMVQRAKD